jgi:hypothetical protein
MIKYILAKLLLERVFHRLEVVQAQIEVMDSETLMQAIIFYSKNTTAYDNELHV